MAEKRNNNVRVRVELDPACGTPEVVIRTDRETELVKKLAAAVERCARRDGPPVTVYDGNTALRLDTDRILRIYTQPRKVMVCTGSRTYESRCSLQEMETLLGAERFVRISRFEIINMERVIGFDVSVSGTIQVRFEDGSATWVARRYVHAIEQRLEHLIAKGDGENE